VHVAGIYPAATSAAYIGPVGNNWRAPALRRERNSPRVEKRIRGVAILFGLARRGEFDCRRQSPIASRRRVTRSRRGRDGRLLRQPPAPSSAGDRPFHGSSEREESEKRELFTSCVSPSGTRRHLAFRGGKSRRVKRYRCYSSLPAHPSCRLPYLARDIPLGCLPSSARSDGRGRRGWGMGRGKQGVVAARRDGEEREQELRGRERRSCDLLAGDFACGISFGIVAPSLFRINRGRTCI